MGREAWIALVLLAGGAVALALRAGLRRRRARERIVTWLEVEEAGSRQLDRSGLAGWLARAGLRSEGAPARFLGAQAAAVVAGLAVVVLLLRSSLVRQGREALLAIPGGAGALLEPVLFAAPVLAFVLLVSLPLLAVRRRRAERLTRIEQDLPLVLELLASLAQSGLGFDAALARIVDSQDPERPLIADLRLFQGDTLSGFPRVQTYERFGMRCAAPGVDVLVAALIHAEQLGASIATTLRTQADEAWNDRKERMLARSQSLPTRLAAPLVVCFLPGLLVVTLAPALVRFSELVSGVLDGNG
jgi:tight adherence protein C